MNSRNEITATRYRINSILIAMERGRTIRLDQWHRVLKVRSRLQRTIPIPTEAAPLYQRIEQAIEQVTEPCVHEGGAYHEGCGVCAPLWGRRIRLDRLTESV